MREHRVRSVAAAVAVCIGALAVTGCGSSASRNASGSTVVNGATFNVALSADPGNLDPQGSVTSNLGTMTQFAYDPLVNEGPTGKISSGLASSWKVTGKTVVLTLHKAITCAGGAPFTATDAAANINYVADPKSKSPLLGAYLPEGAHATADKSTGTVTMSTPTAAPFVLDGLANIPMVCAAGMKNRKTLAHETDGTGPYQLTQADPGAQYTYTKRAGYTWGPGGAGTATKGMPAKVVFKIIPNGTTAANLLLSGGLNAATVLGADSQRLTKAHTFSSNLTNLLGEMWFNESKDLPTADDSVRVALTKALDLPQLQKVLTSGLGGPATTLAAYPPVACPGNSVQHALPTHDLAAARQMLNQAGWKMGAGGVRSKDGKSLSLTFAYDTTAGAAGSAAGQLAVSVWKQLGVNVTLKPQDSTAISSTLFSTGDWNIVWEPVNVSTPDQLVPFLAGPVPPKGTNFAHIDNAQYSAEVAKASAIQGAAGCPDWLTAEANLIRAADVVPFANQVLKTFGSGARFTQSLEMIPTSIRMLAH